MALSHPPDVAMGGYNVLRLAGTGPFTSMTVSVVVATVVAFLANRSWTFSARRQRGLGLACLLSFLINGVALFGLGCLAISSHVLGLSSALAGNISANGVGLVLGTLFRFWAYHRWVFPTPSASALQPGDRLQQCPHRIGFSPGGEGELVLDGARPAVRLTQLAAELVQDLDHRVVVGIDQRAEPADALLGRAVHDAVQQLGAQPPALPLVDDRDGDLGELGVIGVTDVTGHPDPPPVTRVQGPDRLVVVVVHAGEVPQLPLGEVGLGREEAEPPGLVAQPLEAVGQQGRVGAVDLVDVHLGAVPQHHPVTSLRAHGGAS